MTLTDCRVKVFLPKHLFPEKIRQKYINTDDLEKFLNSKKAEDINGNCIVFHGPSSYTYSNFFDNSEITVSHCRPEIIIENFPTKFILDPDTNPIEGILNKQQNRFQSQHLTLNQLLYQPALNKFGELARKAIYELFPADYYGRLLNTRIAYLYSRTGTQTTDELCSIRITFRVHHDNHIHPTWIDWQTPQDALEGKGTKREIKALRKKWIQKDYPRRHPDIYLAPIPILDEETIEKLRTVYATFCARDIQHWIESSNTPPQLHHNS